MLSIPDQLGGNIQQTAEKQATEGQRSILGIEKLGERTERVVKTP